ncbi:MAG: ImuA family protein [Sphingomonas sp.]
MRDSIDSFQALRTRIAATERRQAVSHGVVPLGHSAIDAALGGGLGRGQLHEIFAVEASDNTALGSASGGVVVAPSSGGQSGAPSGFAAMLCAMVARPGGTIFWLREQAAEARGGCLHAPGLRDLGVDPARLVLGVMDDALALLRAAAEVVRCPTIDVAVIELWKSPRALDLTATRRLAVAAENSGTTALLLRAEASPMPSAAHTRWSVASVAAKALGAGAPGHPTLEVELLRQRGGSAGQQWRVEWNREQAKFFDPALSGAVVPLSFGRPVATPGWRRAG